MDRYVNEKCPACSKPFADGDDVVVCPQCGTPHHRGCWLEKGDCVNKPLHGEGYVWTGENKPHIEVSFDEKNVLGLICPRCGTNNRPDRLFCSKCGLPKGASPNTNKIYNNVPPFIHNEDFTPPYGFPHKFSPEDEIDGVPAIEVAEYVSTNSRRYVSEFMKNRKISWNWGAFAFGSYWFFYRKLSKLGAAFLALTLSVNLIFGSLMGQTLAAVSKIYDELFRGLISEQTAIFDITEIINNSGQGNFIVLYGICVLSLRIIMALFADYMYRKAVIQKIGNIRKDSLNSSAYRAMLMLKGGVSFVAVGLAFLSEYIFEIFIQKLISL